MNSTTKQLLKQVNADIQRLNDGIKKEHITRREYTRELTSANSRLFSIYKVAAKEDEEKESIGIILYEDKDVVCLATGFEKDSENDKTGGMIQTWILYKHAKPSDALKLGMDYLVCGNCKHRGLFGKGRTCYVNLGQGPRAAFDAWRRGRYEKLNDENIKWFDGRKLRLGSYGDPAFVPVAIWRKVLKHAENDHTGYTHQWKVAPHLKDLCMASVDNLNEAADAWAQGWRSFRITDEEDEQENEIHCPASEEMGKRTTCEKCGLCGGSSKKAKSIVIYPHGIGKGHFASNV